VRVFKSMHTQRFEWLGAYLAGDILHRTPCLPNGQACR
jgi:hypothetical protein